MTEFSKLLSGLKLPSWLNKGDPARLLRGSVKFWSQVYGWITWPLKQFDPLVCPEPLLNLIAWERDIDRFKDAVSSLMDENVTQKRQYFASVADSL